MQVADLLNLPLDSNISISGRVVSFRRMGNVSFGNIQDFTGKIQFCIRKDKVSSQNQEYGYKDLCNDIVVGSIISIDGVTWKSGTGESTILVNSAKVIQKPLRGFPSSYYGISDEETRNRKRYLETSIDQSEAKVFTLRSKVISGIRNFLITEENFLEVETPTLTPQASGAIAKPFVTHHNALGKDFYLRIAPETYLKMMTAGGFSRIFEIGKSFRNEGIDRSHIQEFTSLEWYAAYEDYNSNKTIFLNLLNHILITNGFSDKKITWGEYNLDFSNIKTVKYRDLFRMNELPSPDRLSASEADDLFKKTIRPTLIQPIIVEDYPAHMSPMAARKDTDPTTVEQWQLIVGGWEIVKCYTELTDPVLQRSLLEEQALNRASGDDEAMMLDESFLEAMEYGMPPQSGLGIGIDRLICILANKKSLKDIIFFPMLG